MYKDKRGLDATEQVYNLLHEVGKTEEEVIKFLGPTLTKNNGAVLYFLQHLSALMTYYLP